jgi:zinc transporter 1/2/3
MDKSAHDSKVLLFSIKISCMVFLFLVIIVVGSLPIRLAAFQTNKVITIDHKLKVLLACTAAFSGGLFFSVGLLHLLSESSANFEEYFATNGSDPGEEHFPYAFLTATLSFTFVLWIEKIAVSHQHDNHHHEPSHEVSELSKVRDSHENNDALIDRHQSAPVLIERNNSAPIGYQENCTQDEE